MLGEFVTSILVLLLGYAYPAFECFRTIERNRPQIEQFRFWCQYWIIMGLMTAVEKFGDLFVSWLPLYGELKLAFIIYLWHPKTQGAWYVYNKFVYPFLAVHESGIDSRLMEIGQRSGEWLMFYVRNFTDRGQSMAFDLLQYLLRQASGRASPPPAAPPRGAPPPPPAAGGAGMQWTPPPPAAGGAGTQWPAPSAPPVRHEETAGGAARHRPSQHHRRPSQEERAEGIAEVERLVREMKAAAGVDHHR